MKENNALNKYAKPITTLRKYEIPVERMREILVDMAIYREITNENGLSPRFARMLTLSASDSETYTDNQIREEFERAFGEGGYMTTDEYYDMLKVISSPENVDKYMKKNDAYLKRRIVARKTGNYLPAEYTRERIIDFIIYNQMTNDGLGSLPYTFDRVDNEDNPYELQEMYEDILRRIRTHDLTHNYSEVITYLNSDEHQADYLNIKINHVRTLEPTANAKKEGAPTVNDGEKGTSNPDDEIETIQRSLDRLLSAAEKLEHQLLFEFNSIQTLITSIDEIKALMAEYTEIKNKWESLFAEIKDTKNTDINVVKDKLKELRKRIKEIKELQINMYNKYVIYVNEKITLIRNNSKDIPELVGLIDLVQIEMPKKLSFNTNFYFKYINYEEIIKRLNIINKYYNIYAINVNQPLPPTPVPPGTPVPPAPPTSDIQRDYDLLCLWLDEIEKKITDLKNKLSGGIDKLNDDELKDCRADLAEIFKLMNAIDCFFEVRKDDIRNLIGEDACKKILTRIDDAHQDLRELSNMLDKKENDIYQSFGNRLNTLGQRIKDFDKIIVNPSLDKKLPIAWINMYRSTAEGYKKELNDLFEEIKKAHDEGKLTDDEFGKLSNFVSGLETNINSTIDMINKFEEFKELGFFDIMGDDIDSIGKEIDKLEIYINDANKPIKMGERKFIDGKFNYINSQIDLLEKIIENHKDDDPDKYNEYVDKLNGYRDRLDELDKLYRKKCPLLVRGYRSAKKFYRQHKKVCLIAAGLAATALVHATVGPVIIPAIMYGNQMLAIKLGGFLNPLLASINKILGGAINAKIVPAVVNGTSVVGHQLANGLFLSLDCANASILGGLSLVGAPIAAVALAIRKIAKIKSNKKNKKKKVEPTVIPEEEITVVESGEEEKEPEKGEEKKNTPITYDVFIKLLIDKNPNVEMYSDDKSNLYVYNPEDLSLPVGYELAKKGDRVTITNGEISFDVYDAANFDLSIANENFKQINKGKDSTERRRK